MAYFKTKMWGERPSLPDSAFSTGAAASPSIPNSGVSILARSSAEVFVLQPPVAGVEKTLVWNTYSTSAAPIVRLSTGTGVVSLLGATTGNSIITPAVTRSTALATVVTLKGINSTSWLMTGVFPATSNLTISAAIVVSS